MTRRTKRCQAFILTSDETKIQCNRVGYVRKIHGRECWVCMRHVEARLEPPELYPTREKCQCLLAAIFGSWDSPIHYGLVRKIKSEIRDLPLRHQHVIVMRFGLGRGMGTIPSTLREAGEFVGVGVERARQIEGRGLRMLRHPTRLGKLRKERSDD